MNYWCRIVSPQLRIMWLTNRAHGGSPWVTDTLKPVHVPGGVVAFPNFSLSQKKSAMKEQERTVRVSTLFVHYYMGLAIGDSSATEDCTKQGASAA